MASENAKAIAEEVLGNLGKCEKVSVLKIAVKRGMKKKYANSGQIQKTKTYRETIEKNKKPILEQLFEERNRAIKALKGKISKAKYRDLTDAIDKLTKNIQLLSGGSTERVVVVNFDEAFKDREQYDKQKGI